MSFKSFTCTVAACCLMAAPAVAVPSLTVSNGGTNGGNQLWSVFVAADPALFPIQAPTTSGSVAVEMGFMFDGTIVGSTVNTGFFNGTFDGVPVENVGNNPFTGTETFGTTLSANYSGTVDGLFAALGSDLFTNATPVLALTIETQGLGGTLMWGGQTVVPADGGPSYMGGRLAQEGINHDGIMGSLQIGGFILGDLNNDGSVNTLDIDPFVLLLTNPAGYAAAFPGVDPVAVGDINLDTSVNTLDIDPFVALLTSGSLTNGGGAVPEPSTVALAGIALVAIGSVCRFNKK